MNGETSYPVAIKAVSFSVVQPFLRFTGTKQDTYLSKAVYVPFSLVPL